jgi:hypothetical protein
VRRMRRNRLAMGGPMRARAIRGKLGVEFARIIQMATAKG